MTAYVLTGIGAYFMLGFIIDFSRFYSWWKKDRPLRMSYAVKRYFDDVCLEHLVDWAMAPVETVVKTFLKIIGKK